MSAVLAILTVVLLAWHWPVLAVAATDLLAWAVWAYTHPFRPCRACRSRPGKNRGSTKRRWGHCFRCKGKPEIQTLGSRMLHRLVRAVRQQTWRR